MAASKGNGWTTISLAPLTGVLDTRSRPADVPPGGLRWKLWMAATPEGKMCRRDGFDRAFFDSRHPELFVNQDHHHQGATREPITMLYECTNSNGTRSLFDGTQSRVSLLDESTGLWTDLVTGLGAPGSVWRAAILQNKVLFTNNVDPVQLYDLDTSAMGSTGNLATINHVTAARVIIEFQGIMLLMNVIQDGQRVGSRIVWSDINDATSWTPDASNPPVRLCGKQDLDYGDEILAAAPMVDALYIFTRRAIWRCTVSGNQNSAFAFQRVYYEPKNQAGCLVYPFTLVSTGSRCYYLSREAIYWYDPYMSQPERVTQEFGDWLHRASGVIFKKTDTALDGSNCNAPISEYLPTKKELWISWPSSGHSTNNWTFVSQFDQRTSDVLDTGFTAFVNYRKTPVTGIACNETQAFLAGSSVDWAIKDIGGVFYLEFVHTSPIDLTADVDLQGSYIRRGYYSILRGQVPLGLYDRNKLVNKVLLDDDVSDSDTPCKYRLRLGNAYNVRDPNDEDDECAVQWFDLGTKNVACVDGKKISAMTAAGQRPNLGKEWDCYVEGRFIFFDLRIENADGSPAIGADDCIDRIDFQALARPKGV